MLHGEWVGENRPLGGTVAAAAVQQVEADPGGQHHRIPNLSWHSPVTSWVALGCGSVLGGANGVGEGCQLQKHLTTQLVAKVLDYPGSGALREVHPHAGARIRC